MLGKCVTSAWSKWERWQTWKATLYSWTRISFKHLKKVWHSKKHEQPRYPYHMFSYSCYFPLLTKYLCWNDDVRGEEKDKTILNLFFFQAFLAHQQVEGRKYSSNVCIIKKWHKNKWVSSMQCFYCSGKNKIHMHIQVMK